MSMKQLEAAILSELRVITGLKALRQKDILEWSTGDVKVEDGETLVHLPSLAVNVSYQTPTKKNSKAALPAAPQEPK